MLDFLIIRNIINLNLIKETKVLQERKIHMRDISKSNNLNNSLNVLYSSSHKSNFTNRKETNSDTSFGIEMTTQDNGSLVSEQSHHHSVACCCCVSISTGAAGLKERN